MVQFMGETVISQQLQQKMYINTLAHKLEILTTASARLLARSCDGIQLTPHQCSAVKICECNRKAHCYCRGSPWNFAGTGQTAEMLAWPSLAVRSGQFFDLERWFRSIGPGFGVIKFKSNVQWNQKIMTQY